VVGYDNVREAAYAYPRLTTVHLPLLEMGVVGVKRLLDKIEEQQGTIKTTYQISMPGELVVRESHKRLQ
jgi:DNA-binding LacI/PurR family transcriptional regulator